jgi:hypothetical protein
VVLVVVLTGKETANRCAIIDFLRDPPKWHQRMKVETKFQKVQRRSE